MYVQYVTIIYLHVFLRKFEYCIAAMASGKGRAVVEKKETKPSCPWVCNTSKRTWRLSRAEVWLRSFSPDNFVALQ